MKINVNKCIYMKNKIKEIEEEIKDFDSVHKKWCEQNNYRSQSCSSRVHYFSELGKLKTKLEYLKQFQNTLENLKEELKKYNLRICGFGTASTLNQNLDKAFEKHIGNLK